MFNPNLLLKGAGKQTAIRTSKRIFLDKGRDTGSRWAALCFMADELTKGRVEVSGNNSNILLSKRGDEAENLGYDLWVCDTLQEQIGRLIA
jgi:hypothetical protein